jgi:CYTH domain-containing protein
MDVFVGTLEGLLLAEAEFDSAADTDALSLPSSIWPEVSADNRFTGPELVRASREDIRAALPEYRIRQRWAH